MSTPASTLRVSLVQNSAGRDPAANLKRLNQLIAGTGETDVIALPEVFAIRGSDDDYRQSAEPIPGPLTRNLAQIARRRNAWLLAGSLIEKAEGGPFNTSVLFDREGHIAATYRKMHLFEAHLESGQIIRESDVYQAGGKPVMADIEGWSCGLSICYDLRFPELYRHYSHQGAHLLFVPSNFTQRTGKDHWEILVRARAIENQCFLVAPGQCGVNPATGVASYGHSMAAGPWGEILCAGGEGEGIWSVTLDPAHLDQTRHRVPALRHRRLQ